jgi:4-hydroxy-3-methylbut-2-enyl diphosphate reductase
VQSYLVDGAEDLQLEWFNGVETVLMTAGASAPESAVQECVHYLQHHFNALVSDAVLRQESIRFPLPRELQILRGVENGNAMQSD